jgi:AcrR family transcriptional regulator
MTNQMQTEPAAAAKKSDRTRGQVLDAAAKLFREQGFAATTLRQIAARAKIKAGSIYYYFSSKDDILDEVLDLGIKLVFEAVRTAVDELPPAASGRERLEAAIRAHLYALLKYSDYTSANIRIFGQLPRSAQKRNQRVRESYTAFWNQLLSAAQSSGEIGRSVDLSLARMFLLGSMNWTVEWYDPKGHPIEKIAGRLCTTLFEGIGTG